MGFKKLLLGFFLIFVCNITKAQVSTYTFIDPCTKEVTMFSVPIQGGKTMIIFLDNVGYFDANDLSNGTFTNWVNQTYTKYRQTNPCSQQQGQVIQNQITAQIIGGTIQSVVSSILSSSQAQSTSLENGSSSSDAGGKDNKNSEKKKNNNSSQSNGNNSSQSNTTSTTSTQAGGQSQSNSGTNNTNGGSGSTSGNGNTTNGGGTSSSSNTTQGGNSTTQPSVGTNTSTNNNSGSTNSGGSGGTNNSSTNNTNTTNGGNGSSSNTSGNSTTNTNGSSTTSGSNGNNSNSGGSNTNGSNGSNTGGSTNGSGGGSNGSNTGGSTNGNGGGTGSSTTGGSGSNNTNGNTNTNNQKGEEVGATTQMNNDAHNDNNAGGGSNSGGKGKSGGGGSARSNPIIVSSDLTSAQNLNRTFTPIVNIGTSKSSMTGLSSYGVTGMVWLNFKQFAVSAKYTKIHYSKTKKLKFIHNLNLTGVYTYGNYLGFVGYSGILNGGKYGVTGFNISGAATIISEEKSGYYSPSITAFYTRPIKVGKKMIVSPELYVISTPLVYSTKDKVSISDRYVSGFIGTGIDYQISKRFKLNVNYKANMSTNPEFPILSFFLIGSKINL